MPQQCRLHDHLSGHRLMECMGVTACRAASGPSNKSTKEPAPGGPIASQDPGAPPPLRPRRCCTPSSLLLPSYCECEQRVATPPPPPPPWGAAAVLPPPSLIFPSAQAFSNACSNTHYADALDWCLPSYLLQMDFLNTYPAVRPATPGTC